MILVWLEFAGLAAVIAVGGFWLSRFGDVISEKTGLSGGWIGFVLLASVTSLPELVVGVSAVTVADAPDIAVGNVLGACVLNLLVLAVIDLIWREGTSFQRASLGHILSANFATMLLGLIGLSIILADGAIGLSFGHVGLITPIIGALYLVALRVIFTYERRAMMEQPEVTSARYPGMTLKRAVLGYAAAAAVVVAAGLFLPVVAEELAAIMGWNSSFVGTLFVAMATTLPELMVTIGAVRIGALDMAIANLLGSNLFNIVVLAVDDLVYLKGPLLAAVSETHAATALSALVMNGIASVAFLYRSGQRLLKTVSWASMALLAVYLLNAAIVFLHGE